MNISFKVKNTLKQYDKPYSDFKLINEYSQTNNLSDNQTLDFTITYCKGDYPIQYLVGYEYFLSRKIFVNENVLIPRMETEEVVLNFVNEIKSKYNKGDNIKVLDLCCGSGAILIGVDELIGKDYNLQLYASDISLKALEVSKINYNEYNLKVEVIQSNLLEYFINSNIKFDCIISNPPYIPFTGEIDQNVVKYEPHLALFAKDEGLYFYYKIIDSLNKVLNEKSIVCFEIGIGQSEKIKNKIIKTIKFNKNAIIYDMNKADRIILLSR